MFDDLGELTAAGAVGPSRDGEACQSWRRWQLLGGGGKEGGRHRRGEAVVGGGGEGMSDLICFFFFFGNQNYSFVQLDHSKLHLQDVVRSRVLLLLNEQLYIMDYSCSQSPNV